ncbi:MAG: lectin like domain-containing protein [bacterium]
MSQVSRPFVVVLLVLLSIASAGPVLADESEVPSAIISETSALPSEISISDENNITHNATEVTGQAAPLNPAFIQYQKDYAVGQIKRFTANGFRLGHIPSPLDLSHLKSQSPVSAATFALPASYDCRTAGKVSGVRNQGSAGSCWAFATYGSMESCLLPSSSCDFSENNMKNLLSAAYPEGFDRAHSDGGNCLMSSAYLLRWTGPLAESDDPYNATSGVSPTDKPPRKHIQTIIYPPARANLIDNGTLKQLVLDYGGIDSSIYYDDYYYNDTTHAYYFYGSSNNNHDITLVGWDDNYSATNFSPAAPGNGAFIAKNSWGTSWGQNGYFYISYFDVNIGKENAQFRYAESTTNYVRVYQYDPYGLVDTYGFGNTTGWFANIFTAKANENIAAAGWYAQMPNTAYEISVYKTPNSGPINTGGAALTKTGTVTEAGFVTIPFGSTVSISSGQRFSVVVKATTPGYYYPIPVEYPETNYCSKATGNPGESFISSNGSTWSDISAAYKPKSNVCLKAYTKAGTPAPKVMNSYGQFSTASDTTKWYYQVYADGSGPGTLAWVSSFTGQTGVVRFNQSAGQKAKLSQTFSVPSAGWYTAKAKVATDVTGTSKQPKIYLYLQEMNSSAAIIACANEVIASGGGGFSRASTWKNLEVSYYASGTCLGVQVVGINPSGSGTNGNIYFDDITVTPTAPEGFTGSSVTITNYSFTTTTTCWMVEVYADGTGPGTWCWCTGCNGRNGLMHGMQAGGEKGKASQVLNLPSSADKNAYVSIWVNSGAASIDNSQKVYLYLYSYNTGYGKVMESGNAVLYSGYWTPGTWRELKFGYTPMSIYNVVQFIGINPSGKPTQSIYFDLITIKQES